MESVLSIRGHATIPKAIREHLHLEPGDRIKFFVHPDGTVVILPKVPASTLKGIVPKRKHPWVSLEKIDCAIADGAIGGMHRSPLR